jgi:asparagine synthase (glutamine-hydrolysing)
MCGIVGVFDTRERRPVDLEALARMNAVQFHRGPDEGGQHAEPGVGLGHRRLSIIDLATGQQPLWNEDHSVVVVFNGEIYNYRSLIPRLEAAGHVFRTRSDTEVIVHAWEEWGEACVREFNGMFAFCLWDRNRQTLFLARDRLGEKPLYWTVDSAGWFAFASELKSLVARPGQSRRIDPLAVEEYLGFGYVPEPRTIYAGIHKLPPAHTLTLRVGTPPRLNEYWQLSFASNGIRTVEAAIPELRERLREAVRLRMVSEVPLGAFLSGGVDSSAIVANMASLQSDPVDTCSISFGDPRYNESPYAAAVAKQFGTRHHVDQVESDDFSLLDTLVAAYDEPFADSSAMPTYRVCQLARQHVTVALSGDAGDENFAGYRRHRWHMEEERLRRFLPQAIRGPLFGLAGALYPKLDWAPQFLRAKTTLESLARSSMAAYFHSVSVMPDRVRQPLYSSAFRSELGGYRALEVFQRHAAQAPADDALSFIQYLDLKTYLPGDILVKVDRASMQHGLEVRVPLLDHTLVEWIAGLPSALKLHRGEGKYVFKKSLEGTLTDETLYRPKMGFAVPLDRWFRGPLRSRIEGLARSEALDGLGVFATEQVGKLATQHLSGRRDHTAALWSLLMLEGFARKEAAV